MKQLIEEQRQEFEDLFCDREMVVKDGITQIKYKPTQEAIFDWHKQSLKQFIDGFVASSQTNFDPDSFVEMYHEDQMGGLIRNVEGWIQTTFRDLLLPQD